MKWPPELDPPAAAIESVPLLTEIVPLALLKLTSMLEVQEPSDFSSSPLLVNVPGEPLHERSHRPAMKRAAGLVGECRVGTDVEAAASLGR